MQCKLLVKALYPYTAQSDGELSFGEGDLLLILDDTDQHWWLAQERSSADAFQEAPRQGDVPVNYVEEVGVGCCCCCCC